MNVAASMQGLPNLAAHPRMQRAAQWLSAHAPTIATGAATILIAWQLARLTWMLLPTPPEPPVTLAPTQASQPAQTARLNVQKIADAHLFGLATAEAEPTDPANAPQTQVPLVLAGVLASSDPTKGYAFIGESAASAKFRKVGDALTGGVTLHSVYLDRVMLDRAGRLESLSLPRFSGGTAIARPAAASPPPASQPAQFAQNLRRIAETNPSAFSEIVRPQPVFQGGVQRGFRVYPGRNRTQFTKLGLQPGDLVLAVNGTPLTDPASGNQIFNTISTTDRVTLTVERNGQTQQLNVNTAQIELPDASAGMPPTGNIENATQ
jgi:general secretion pathway protein C